MREMHTLEALPSTSLNAPDGADKEPLMKRKTSRAAIGPLALAVILLHSAGVVSADEKINLKSERITFRRRSDGVKVFDRAMFAAIGAALGPTELGPVPTTALSTLKVMLNSKEENTSRELLLFARDPEDQAKKLAAASWASAFGKEKLKKGWEDETHRFPQVVSLPFPGGPGCVFAGCATEWQLTQDAFFGPSVFIGNPAPPGNIKAVRVYDHGACSKEERYATHFADIEQRVSSGLKSVDIPMTDVILHTVGLAGYVDHKAGNVTDTGGGIFLAAHATVDFPCGPTPGGCAFDDAKINFAYRYALKLTNGMIDVEAIELVNAVGGSFSTTIRDAIREQAKKEFPKAIRTAAGAAQLADVLGGLDAPSGSSCADPANLFWSGVSTGAALVNEFTNPDRFSATDLTDLEATAKDPANWKIVTDSKQVPHCRYTVRGKRLNRYPDAFQIVFFDGKEPKNPAYVASVALEGRDYKAYKKAGSSGPVPRTNWLGMCSFLPATLGSGENAHNRRNFAVSIF
jgi:hypothetical protein